jgi:hypothetical protein
MSADSLRANLTAWTRPMYWATIYFSRAGDATCPHFLNFLFFYLFFHDFPKKIYVSFQILQIYIPPPLYDMAFGSNHHMVEWLDVLQCFDRCITQRLWTVPPAWVNCRITRR